MNKMAIKYRLFMITDMTGMEEFSNEMDTVRRTEINSQRFVDN